MSQLVAQTPWPGMVWGGVAVRICVSLSTVVALGEGRNLVEKVHSGCQAIAPTSEPESRRGAKNSKSQDASGNRTEEGVWVCGLEWRVCAGLPPTWARLCATLTSTLAISELLQGVDPLWSRTCHLCPRNTDLNHMGERV